MKDAARGDALVRTAPSKSAAPSVCQGALGQKPIRAGEPLRLVENDKPAILRTSRIVKFLAFESSKWSMADIVVLAIFMSFVAFNGLIGSAMEGLRDAAGQLAIPTNSSKILPGYYLFIGFCLASMFLSKKLERGISSGPVSSVQELEPINPEAKRIIMATSSVPAADLH